MNRILIAGIGNIFLGDDAFGVEVIRRWGHRQLPHGVVAKDFGIRSYDLVYALTENYDAVILVDATPRGEAPGSLYLIQPDLAQIGPCGRDNLAGHSMDPVRVLRTARALGAGLERLYLVGCEPDSPELEERMGLSPAVEAAVPKAVQMIETLVADLLEPQQAQAA